MLAVTVVNVLFPTPPFWLEKAINFVLFVASISILFLSFCFRGLPAVLHGAGLSSLHTVRQSWYNSVCRACRHPFSQPCRHSGFHAGMTDGLPVVLPGGRATGLLSCYPVFLPAVWNAVMRSGFPAILRSGLSNCHRERMPANRLA